MKDFDAITDLDLKPSSDGNATGSFKVAKDFDYEATLNELAKNNEHIKGWSKN